MRKKGQIEQVNYLGRWVDKTTFRAYVYNADSEKLVNSYSEYEDLISSGLWFPEKDKVVAPLVEKPNKARKPKDVTDS